MTLTTRTETLLSTLTPDSDRDAALATLRKRETQYETVTARAGAIRDRIAEITEALPDATARGREALRAERAALLAEQTGLPLDVKVAARLFAGAVVDVGSVVTAAVATERRAVMERLGETDAAFREARHEVGNVPLTDPRHPAAYAALQEVIAQRKPHDDRRHDLEELAALIREYVVTVLDAGKHRTGHGQVKLVDGRPIAAHIDGFVDAVSGRAA